MSDIDEAFINAYRDLPPATIPLVTLRQPTGTMSNTPSRGGTGESPLSGQSLRMDAPARATPNRSRRSSTPKIPTSIAAVGDQGRGDGAELANDEIVLPPLGRERRPLSSFAAPIEPPQAVFKPTYEVDAFRWPKITERLLSEAHDLLTPLVEKLGAAAYDGRSLIGVAGADRGAGATAFTLCLARRLSEAGHTTAVVDANFSRGSLASELGVEFNLSWNAVLAGEIPLADCAVHCLQDQLTLIPLAGPAASVLERITSIHTAVMAGMLRYHHDLVLFDLGAANDPLQLQAIKMICHHCRLDLNLVVAPTQPQSGRAAEGVQQLTNVFGETCFGIVGNCAE